MATLTKSYLKSCKKIKFLSVKEFKFFVYTSIHCSSWWKISWIVTWSHLFTYRKKDDIKKTSTCVFIPGDANFLSTAFNFSGRASEDILENVTIHTSLKDNQSNKWFYTNRKFIVILSIFSWIINRKHYFLSLFF